MEFSKTCNFLTALGLAAWLGGCATPMTEAECRAADWYKLGEPFDIQTPAGLRTAYPLSKMETVEVVRRGIQYELPRLIQSARPRVPRASKKTPLDDRSSGANPKSI